MMKLLAGLFVGVFVGALTYEVVRKGEFTRRAARRVSEGVQAAKHAFDEGYRSIQPAPDEPLPVTTT
jgi:hypothetical protein